MKMIVKNFRFKQSYYLGSLGEGGYHNNEQYTLFSKPAFKNYDEKRNKHKLGIIKYLYRFNNYENKLCVVLC